MQPDEIIFSPNAEREVKRLTKNEQKIVLEALKRWRSGDGNVSLEKIRSQPDFYRLKAKHIRIVYYPLGQKRVVLLLIRDRKDAYRSLDSLPERLSAAMRKLRLVAR